jgi:hypothetical protein
VAKNQLRYALVGQQETPPRLSAAIRASPIHRFPTKAKKAAPLLGPRFKEAKLVGDVRKGDGSSHSAGNGTSGNVEKERE